MKNALFFFLLLGVGASFAAGFYTGKTQGYIAPIQGVTNLDVGQPQGVDFSLFWDAWRIIQERYVNSEHLDYQAMVQGAIDGMVRSLGDSHTIFLDPNETRMFQEEVAGSFEGVGMEIGIREKELRVIAPLEGTPAQRAGLRAGDRIVKIGDTSTSDLNVDEAIALIRGPKGTTVTLSIFREGWEKPRDFAIERAVIIIPSLKWELKQGDIAYIKLFQFSEKARADFKWAVKEIVSSPAKKIVLDLRNNPGGFLEVAVDIAAWFLERGEIVVIEDFGSKQDPEEYKARGNPRLLEYPLVVLINEGSASASEIVAGALRDHRNIPLIGEKSFGKGSVQELEYLRDQSSLKITVAKWLTPKGDLITDKGLEPNIKVELTEEDIAAEKDPQLDKAIETVNNL